MSIENTLLKCETAFLSFIKSKERVQTILHNRRSRWSLWLADSAKHPNETEQLRIVSEELLKTDRRASLESREIGLLLTDNQELLLAISSLNVAKAKIRLAITDYRQALDKSNSEEEATVAKEWLTKGQMTVGDKTALLKRWPKSGEKISFQKLYRINRVLPYPIERWEYFWDAGIKRTVKISRPTAYKLIDSIKSVAGIDKEAFREIIESLPNDAYLRKVSPQKPQLKAIFRFSDKPDTGNRTNTCPAHGIIVIPQTSLPERFKVPIPLTLPPPTTLDPSVYEPVIPKLGLYLHRANKKRGRKPRRPI